VLFYTALGKLPGILTNTARPEDFSLGITQYNAHIGPVTV